VIEINLLPPEYKEKIKKEQARPPIYIFFLLLAILILLFLNLTLGVFFLFKGIQKGTISFQWNAMKSQRQEVERFKEKYETVTQDSRFIQQFLNKRLNWAEKLNQLSLDLPAGIWFASITYNKQNRFTLEGSTVSLQKNEVELINNFLENLKKDQTFFKDFKRLDLGPLRRREIKSYDVVDFVFFGETK